MASYLITGASRGLGYEFVRQLSQDPRNIVIGLVRNKKATDERIHQEFKQHENVHIVQADLADYKSIQNTVPDVTKITGGSLDYIIANAGLVSSWSAYDSLGTLSKDPARLEQDLLDSFKVNVVGNVHLFTSYVPLVLKGKAKKVITLSSGMADLDLINKFEVDSAAPYAISKAAVNAAVAKYNAEYGKQGVLFLAISPGFVGTENNVNIPPERLEGFAEMGKKFASYAPDFKGMATPEESIQAILSVIDKASVETGFGGGFVSHKGNKQWL